MVSKTHPVIAREGFRNLFLICLFLFLVGYFVNTNSALALLPILVLAIAFYRDPARKVPALPLGIVSPVDGKITSIEKEEDPYLERSAVVITLRKSISGIGSVRSPIEGKLNKQWHGSDKQPSWDLASWVRTDEGDDVVWMLRKNVLTKPAVYVQPGERVGQGQRCGFQLLGGNVKVYLPLNSRVEVKPGDHVLSGTSVIAHVVHKTASPNLSVEAGMTEPTSNGEI